MLSIFSVLKRGYNPAAAPSVDPIYFYALKGHRYRNKRMDLLRKTYVKADAVYMSAEDSLLAFANFSMAIVVGGDKYFQVYAERAISIMFLFLDLFADPIFLKRYIKAVGKDNPRLSQDVLSWLERILGERFETRSKKACLQALFGQATSDLAKSKELYDETHRLFPGGDRFIIGPCVYSYETLVAALREYAELLQARDIDQALRNGKIG